MLQKPHPNQPPAIDIHSAAQVNRLDAQQLIQLAHTTFGDKLYALSSFGVDSAVMLRLIQKAGLNIPIITIDTGFWFDDTHQFKKWLAKEFGLKLLVYGPDQKTINNIKKTKLWESDVKEYNRLVKLEPLSRAVKELGVQALLSGIHHDQTSARAEKPRVETGQDGELRVYPILDWTQHDVDKFMADEQLLKHPLFYEGYASVGDWTTTKKGANRQESRAGLGEQTECGLHWDEKTGKLVSSSAK
jgi:phosphoadenosine phosphosulfate reductase